MKKTTLLLAHLLARRACLWAVLGLLTAVTFGPPPAQAAVTEAWVHRYNNVVSNSYDAAFAVVRDTAGDIIVTGTTGDGYPGGDMLTIKYSGRDGTVLWQQRYNGQGNGFNFAYAVALDGSGNAVVTGPSATVKYAAADGALLWEKHSTNGSASAVAVDGSGNVVVTGSDAGYYTAKYATANGALLWEKRYNGPRNGYDEGRAVAVDGSGNVVVTGRVSAGEYNYDYYTAKYAAANGALLWEQRYNGPAAGYDSASAVAVDGSGNVVVTGSSYNATNGYTDYCTAKYAAANGALLWEQRYNGPANSYGFASAVVVDGSGNVVVTGSSYNAINFDGFEHSITDWCTTKYAAPDGVLLWEQRYNGPASMYDSAHAVAVDESGNVVVTGSSYNSDFNSYYTAKYGAADGALLWEKRGPGGGSAVALDGSGNVVVTGSSYNGTSADYYIAKHAAAGGALLWEQRYNGPANNDDYATAVAVDGSGNVVVTGTSGYSGDGSGNNDYYTAKYAAADGALLWEKRYNGPANSYDSASALVVDGSGNVSATGYSAGTNGYSDCYTAKYAAADGALLWEQRYNGPADGDDRAQAVAVDGSGDVVVAGTSYNTNYTNPDYYTAKYAAADCSLLWEKRYNDPANNEDTALAVAVDGNGNVVVTGYSWNGTNSDYYTAKYAAADGALLWEQRYNGPSNGYDYASSLALGPNGMVVVTGSSSDDFATVVYRDDVYPISIALVPAGIRLRFVAIPGRTYIIERAPAVTGPWTTINTQTAPASGLLEYLDAPPPPGSAFYRTVQP